MRLEVFSVWERSNNLGLSNNVVDDIKQGFTYHYSADGKLWKEVFFVDGLEEGIGRVFAKDDGRVMQLIYHKKGYITDIENINRIDNARTITFGLPDYLVTTD